MSQVLQHVIAAISPASEAAAAAARDRIRSAGTPLLERLAGALAGAQHASSPRAARRLVVVVAGDHGVGDPGVALGENHPTIVAARAIADGSAALCQVARPTPIVLVDAGVAEPSHLPSIAIPLGRGPSRDLLREPPMTVVDAVLGLEAGIALSLSLTEPPAGTSAADSSMSPGTAASSMSPGPGASAGAASSMSPGAGASTAAASSTSPRPGAATAAASATTGATAPASATTGATAPASATTGTTAPASATTGATAPASATTGATAPASATTGTTAPASATTGTTAPASATAPATGRLDVLAIGAIGVGSEVASAAIVAAITGRVASLDERDDAAELAMARALSLGARSGLDLLANVGGPDTAVLAGLILGAASMNVPVILDGYATGAAALVAVTLAPAVAGYLIAAHRGGFTMPAIIEHLGLTPVFDVGLGHGEGTGAAMVLPLLDQVAALAARS